MVPSRRQEKRNPAPYPRAWRVNQVVRQVLAEEIERLADADERLRLVTVTGVETAPDLRRATVFLSSLEDDAADALGRTTWAAAGHHRSPGPDEAHATARLHPRPGSGGGRPGRRRLAPAPGRVGQRTARPTPS